MLKEKDFNEAELDFYYLTSPAELEKKLNFLSFNNYQPIKYSKIYFDIFDFSKIQNKISCKSSLPSKSKSKRLRD